MKHLPNFITCLNLLSGCIGVVASFQGSLTIACLAILVAACFDFFDGMAARLLHYTSPIGKELDSLADVISFGLLPSCIIYQLISTAIPANNSLGYLAYGAFILTVFSALRLAKFNIDQRQASHFIGLPTPSSALVVCSLPFIIRQFPQWTFIQNHWLLLTLTLVLSGLLVAEIPLLSLKFKTFDLRSNLSRYILLLTGLILLVFLNFAAVPLIIGIYIIISVIQFNGKT